MNCVRYGIPLSPIYVQFNFLRYVLRLKLFTLHTRTMLGLLKRHQQLGDALPCPTPFHIIYAHLFIHYTCSPHMLLPPSSAPPLLVLREKASMDGSLRRVGERVC